MTTDRPLLGRRIVITRAAAQVGPFASLLADAGAEVIEAPTIRIEPPASWAPLDDALRDASSWSWIVFTSVNGVDMVEQRLSHLGLDWGHLARPRAAAIGPATAAALGAHGMGAVVIPREYRAEGLLDALRSLIRPRDRVLLPRAADTRDVLVTGLVELGADVVEVAAYRTRRLTDAADRLREELGRGAIDVVSFTSSSTARNFATLFEDAERHALMRSVAVASIGPITAATAASYGLTTHIMPAAYTIPALAAAIAEYFRAGDVSSAGCRDARVIADPMKE